MNMYQPYRCNINSFENYYTDQVGNGLLYYQGARLQKGSGLGGIFRRMLRFAFPLFKSGVKAVGKQVLRSGVDIANDYVQGKDIKTSAKEKIKEAGKLLTDKAASKVKTMIGSGRNKRRRKHQKKIIRSKVRKVNTPDIFS